MLCSIETFACPNSFIRSCCLRNRRFPLLFSSRHHPTVLSSVTSSRLGCTCRLHSWKRSCCSHSRTFYVSIETAKCNQFILLPCTSTYFFKAFSRQCIIKLFYISNMTWTTQQPIEVWRIKINVFVDVCVLMCTHMYVCLQKHLLPGASVTHGCEWNMYVLELGLQSS